MSDTEEATNRGGSLRSRARREGLIALVFVQVFFGLFPLFIKQAIDGGAGFTPRALAVWRIGFGALVLAGAAVARHGRGFLPGRGDLPRLALCAFLGVVVNIVLALEGVARTTVVHAGLLFTLIPVFTYAIALLARQERFLLARAAGIVLALAGAAWLVLARGGGAVELGSAHLVGSGLIAINCTAYAGYLVLARPLFTRYGPLVLIAWVFVLALPWAPLLALDHELLPAAVSARAWTGFAYTLVFPTVLAYLLNAYALARVSASTTAAFIYLQPLVAGAGGMLVLHERLAPGALVGALLLLFGLGLVLWRRTLAR